ncbi:MAG: ileS, partial [Candidatus Saccharibacteria bacterium]|nr:ileS [Candidatus Saccharibacteria bacterium]
LFGSNAFKNVITTGTLAGNDGRKMSKSYGNFTDPNELMDKFSADSLRFLLMSSPVMAGEDFSLQDKEVGDVARKLTMIWNMYDFFTMYAEVDGWEWNGSFEDPMDDLTNPLDRWIVSRVHQLNTEISENMERYDIPTAMKGILPLLDDASNWYVRRSRRRFWKSEDDTDKNDAYRTLHYVLLYLSHLLAPFTPFLAEELFLKLTGGELGESVHLRDWPKAGKVVEKVLFDMARTREIIEKGLAARMFKSESEQQIKVRQPLQRLQYSGPQLDGVYEVIIAEEVNVHQVFSMNPEGRPLGDDSSDSSLSNTNVVLDKTITPELAREGMMREVVRQVQNARKQAGLNVDDRIHLELVTHDPELEKAIDEHTDTIATETLASELITVGSAPAEGYTADVKVDGVELAIALSKV